VSNEEASSSSVFFFVDCGWKYVSPTIQATTVKTTTNKFVVLDSNTLFLTLYRAISISSFKMISSSLSLQLNFG